MAGDAVKEIAYLATALKAPRIRDTAARLADQARDGGWSHEDYLAAVLEREVAARNASGAVLRIRAAGFTARKTLDEFVFDHQPGVRRDDAAPLAPWRPGTTLILKGPTSSVLAQYADLTMLRSEEPPMLKNLATTWVGKQSVWRRDRLHCNMLAIVDVLRGRITPERIVTLLRNEG